MLCVNAWTTNQKGIPLGIPYKLMNVGRCMYVRFYWLIELFHVCVYVCICLYKGRNRFFNRKCFCCCSILSSPAPESDITKQKKKCGQHLDQINCFELVYVHKTKVDVRDNEECVPSSVHSSDFFPGINFQFPSRFVVFFSNLVFIMHGYVHVYI